MIVNPSIINLRKIEAILNWLHHFPNTPINDDMPLGNIVDPRIINQVLTCVLDSNIEDYSEEFEFENENNSTLALKIKIRYFEKLVTVINNCFLRYNTKVINMTAYNNMEDEFFYARPPKSSSSVVSLRRPKTSSTTKVVVSESYKMDSLNYYLQFILPDIMFSIDANKSKDQLEKKELIQIQAFLFLVVECGLHCKNAPYCSTLIRFLDDEDREEFETFLLSQNYMNDLNGNEVEDRNESPTFELTIFGNSSKFNNDIELVGDDFKENNDLNLVKQSKFLKQENLKLKDEVTILRKRTNLCEKQFSDLKESVKTFINDDEYMNKLTDKYVEAKEQLTEVTKRMKALEKEKIETEEYLFKELEIMNNEKCSLEENFKKFQILNEYKKNSNYDDSSPVSDKVFVKDDYINSLHWEIDLLMKKVISKHLINFENQINVENDNDDYNKVLKTLAVIKKDGTEIENFFYD